MVYFFSKKYREERAKEREFKRQREIEQKEREQKIKMEYCHWYSRQIQNFKNELKEKSFHPSWGFEVESGKHNLYTGEGGNQRGNIYVFDIPSLEGLAFDMQSKQMLYFTCPTGYYDSYQNSNARIDFKYVLIPFYEIFKANIVVNSQQVVSTISSKRNAIGESIAEGIIEGIFGDVADDITDWEEEGFLEIKSEMSLRKITLNIVTSNLDYPIISFKFIKLYDPDPRCAGANKAIVDIMYSTFSDSVEHVGFMEYDTRRKCNTIADYYYYRLHAVTDEDEIKDSWDIKSAILGIILERLNQYAMRIDSVIQQCNKELQSEAQKENSDIVLQLEKLAELKEKGVITKAEFKKLKSKLI